MLTFFNLHCIQAHLPYVSHLFKRYVSYIVYVAFYMCFYGYPIFMCKEEASWILCISVKKLEITKTSTRYPNTYIFKAPNRGMPDFDFEKSFQHSLLSSKIHVCNCITTLLTIYIFKSRFISSCSSASSA